MDFMGKLRFIVVIFATEKLDMDWTFGKDVFAELDESHLLENHGLGNHYPSLNIFHPNGEKVPVMFWATSNGSINSTILCDFYNDMESLGIAKNSINTRGKPFFPANIIDDHVSWIGED